MPRPNAVTRHLGAQALRGALHQGCILAVPQILGHDELLTEGKGWNYSPEALKQPAGDLPATLKRKLKRVSTAAKETVWKL